MYFTRSKKSLFLYTPPPTPATGLLQIIPHPRAQRAGFVKGFSGGVEGQWELNHALSLCLCLCLSLSDTCKPALNFSCFRSLGLWWRRRPVESGKIDNNEPCSSVVREGWVRQNPCGIHSVIKGTRSEEKSFGRSRVVYKTK